MSRGSAPAPPKSMRASTENTHAARKDAKGKIVRRGAQISAEKCRKKGWRWLSAFGHAACQHARDENVYHRSRKESQAIDPDGSQAIDPGGIAEISRGLRPRGRHPRIRTQERKLDPGGGRTAGARRKVLASLRDACFFCSEIRGCRSLARPQPPAKCFHPSGMRLCTTDPVRDRSPICPSWFRSVSIFRLPLRKSASSADR